MLSGVLATTATAYVFSAPYLADTGLLLPLVGLGLVVVGVSSLPAREVRGSAVRRPGRRPGRQLY
jgi:hypothetical protein